MQSIYLRQHHVCNYKIDRQSVEERYRLVSITRFDDFVAFPS